MAHAQGLQLCAQENAGFVVAIQEDQNCDQLPGSWVSLEIEDTDWSGAGTGAMRTGNPEDRVSIGDIDPSARLHVAFSGREDAAVIVENPTTEQEALRIEANGQTVLGGVTGNNAQFTVNAPENEEVIRARAGGVTSFVVAGDGQVGVGTSVPDAALGVSAQSDEDPLRIRTFGSAQPALVFDAEGDLGLGVPEPEDKLAVRNEGLGRAGFFQTDNTGNIAAALSATTTGRGSALFANVLNSQSTSPALHAIHQGAGRAGQFEGDVVVTENVGIGTFEPGAKLVIQGDDDGTDMVVRDNRFARMRMVAEDPAQNVRLTLQARGTADAERAEIGTISDHGMVLFTNGQTRIRLQRNGAVCIGNC
ncbi:hypothetical protein [Cognatiyoonia sp. IB215182]|uniref:hypothetical protein n=1 Tax=Cognatiyoonia sp. IB215182 TaxID=3097353 RepID=UPI002A24D7F7|nr:hypothetical protein [Cognatiyoonia sp. IB215182]